MLANNSKIDLEEPVLNALQEIYLYKESNDIFDINNSPVCVLSPNILLNDKGQTYGDILKLLPSTIDLNVFKDLQTKYKVGKLNPKLLSFTQFKDFSEKGIYESSTQLGLDQTKNHLELSGRVIVGNLNIANSKLIKVISKFQNQNCRLKDLNPSYIPLDKINKTSSINEIMQEINAKFSQIDIFLIKEIGKDLYNKLQRNINPIDFTLSNDLGSIPISIMNKLIDLNLIELSDPTKNAIKKLVDEDIEKCFPFELPLSQIPRSFCICDKFSHQIGRTTGEVIDILKYLNLKPENLNNQDIIDELNKFRINIKDPI